MKATIVLVTFSLLIAVVPKYAICYQADKCSSIVGNWQDIGSVPNKQLMFRIQSIVDDPNQTLFALALTPNPQWGTGRVTFDPSTGALTVNLDSLDTLKGTVSADCSNISWSAPAGAAWLRVPQPDNVHIVFMNHLDVGYARFISDIINEYFDTYFPRAIAIGEMADVWEGGGAGFIYTTHPWLVSLYLDCPPNLIFNGIPVHCPDSDAIAAFEKAVTKGRIVWHAGPMNMQVEFLDSVLLSAGLTIAETLSSRFNMSKSSVLSQRDVPGLTAAAIPVLSKHNIIGVSVGVNPGSAPPAVPKIFKWQLQDDSVIGLWHAGGYPLNPGPDLVDAGGISVRDCTVAPGTRPGTTHALCFAFRTDNTGPPTSLEELDKYYQILREEFPEAHIFASTFNNFFENVNVSALPVLDNKEIGDNWIQGIASDPLKSSTYRAAARGLADCINAADCKMSDPVVFNATRFFIKLPEHTWGLPGIDDNSNWSNVDFNIARLFRSTYRDNENSWREQREFLNLTLEACKGHKLEQYMMKHLKDTLPDTLPDLTKYKVIDPSTTIKLDKVTLGFDPSTGSINGLTCQLENKLIFATAQNQLGVFTYHSYNDSDFTFMNSKYDYYGNAGYSKPGSSIAHPESRTWPVKLVKLYQSTTDANSFIIQLSMANDTLHLMYGAPKEILISLKVIVPTDTEVAEYMKQSQPAPLPAVTLEYDMLLIDKMPTRLPEATMFSFYPNPLTKDGWTGFLGKIFDTPYAELNVGSVVKNGTQYQHAVQYVRIAPLNQTQQGTGYVVWMNSTHVPLVCPITGDGRSPTPFPAPLDPIPDGKITGMAFNLHNNVWNTNYPLYYPFDKSDANFRAKFSVAFYPQ